MSASASETDLDDRDSSVDEETAGTDAEMRADAPAFNEIEERSALEEARARADLEAKAQAAQAEAEDRARAEADAQVKAEAEAQSRAEAEAQAMAEVAVRAKAEAEAKIKEAEARIKEAEAKAREVGARAKDAASKAEARARAEADAKAKAEADARAKADAAAKAKADAEAKLKADAEAKAKAEEQKKAVAKAEAAKKAEPAPVAKKAEPAPVAKKAEPAPVVAKKAEPAPVVAKKAEPAPAVKKGAPVAMGETLKSSAFPAPSSKKPIIVKSKDDEAPVRRVAAFDEELDPSSVSAEFFRKDEDSVPPVEESDDSMGHVVLSPTTLARRARLRRLVAGVVAFAGVISIAVVGKTVAASKRTTTAPTAVVVDSKREAIKAPEPAKTEQKPVLQAPSIEPAKVDEKKADEKKADEPAKVDEKKADEKKPDEPAKVDEKKADEKKPDEKKPSGGDVAALTKETESLLNRGKRKEAMEKAREAIAADPTHAMAYLLLGSALQDTGKWKDGVEVYCDCVRNATKGPVNECRAMGGHK